MATNNNMMLVAMILNALLSDDRNGLLDLSVEDEQLRKDAAKRLQLFHIALAPYTELRAVAHSKVAQKYGLVGLNQKVYEAKGIGHNGFHHCRECQTMFALNMVKATGTRSARNVGRIDAARVYLTRDLGVDLPAWLVDILESPKVSLTQKADDLRTFVVNHYPEVEVAALACVEANPEAHSPVKVR